MEKNTQWLLPSAGSKNAGLPDKPVKEKDSPSAQTVQNILNYSKALKIRKGSRDIAFIEYVAN